MRTKLLNLIDFEEVDKLLEGFNLSTGFVTAVLDLEGNVLSKSGWRQICTLFHRVNPITSKNCTFSDTILAAELGVGEKFHFYKCLNGLVDVAVPIVINGVHIANLFSGQFFFEEPDREFFIKQAQKYGFDEKIYLDVLSNVPIVSKEKVKVAIDFLQNMTQLISEMTFQKLELLQLNEALTLSEARFRGAFDHLLEGCQIIGFDWRFIYLNHTAEIHNRRPNCEMLGNRFMDVWPGIVETELFRAITETLETRLPNRLENKFVFPDGGFAWFDLSIQPVHEGIIILTIDITERKKAENALRDSEEKYRLITDNSYDWIFWIAPDGRLNYVSPACQRVTGYSVEEFTSHPELLQEIIYETDQELFRHHTILPNPEEVPHYLEFRIVTKNNQIRWISHNCSPIFDKNGVYLGRRGTNRNITNRKQKELQLFESEFRFKRLYENGPFGMAIVNSDFRFRNANEAFCSMMRYTEEELQKITFKELTHPEDLLKDFPYIQKLINKEIVVYKTEKRYIRKDRQEIWGSLSLTANYDSEGKYIYILVIIEDITHRKKVEEELVNSKKFLAETQFIGKVGGWDFNLDTRNQTWTDEVYRIGEVDINFNPDDENSLAFFTPESRQVMVQAMRNAIQSGESFDLELEIMTSKMNLRNVHIIGKADLENRRIYGFIQDVTQIKKAEENIRKLNEELEQRVIKRTAQLEAANQDLEAFSYSVSHDLRAPLRHINRFIDLLNERFPDSLPEKARYYLSVIKDSAKHMGTLIDNLLQFSKSSRQEVHKNKLDMNVLVSDVLDKIKHEIKNRKITWVVQDLPCVYGDYHLLTQVWVNLIDNAVKYTKYKESAEIRIECRQDEENYIFLVRDNGVGFDMKHGHKLFGVFQRLHSQSEFEGTGIGLANMKHIVNKHLGQVWAEAEPGKGAAFFFSLPKNI
jgi:PAS domain S-box-containing protein